MEDLLKLGLVNAGTATVLAILVAGLSRLLHRRPAAVHCLWLLVLLKLVTPPIFEVPILDRLSGLVTPSGEAAMVVKPELDAMADDAAMTGLGEVSEVVLTGPLADGSDGVANRGDSWMAGRPATALWLAGAWLIGTAATLVLAVLRIGRFRKLLSGADPVSRQVEEQVAGLAQRFGLRRPPETLWIDVTIMPMLWAVACRPRLIIPRQLWKGLDEPQRSLVLAHELAHLRRRDHLTRTFELLVTACYWWLPTVWWARLALREAEEACCDAWVVGTFPEHARTYAETLLDTVDFLNPTRTKEPLLASGFGRAHHLRRRLTMIMLGTHSPRLGWASTLGTLALSTILLPLSPSWAQKAPEAPQPRTLAFNALEIGDEIEARTVEAVEPEEIHVVVASEGTVDQIQADSLDKAIELIKQRIGTITKQGGGAEKQAAQVRALEKAIADLQQAKARAAASSKTADPTKKEARTVVIRRMETGKPAELTPEKKAEVEKARSRVDTLRKELNDKRQELNDAQRQLAKLLAVQAHYRLAVERPLQVRMTEEKSAVKPKQPQTAPALSRSDTERLELLEKQLVKLLTEVAKLKKHDQGAN